MGELSGMRVVVAGGGALGSAIALAVRRAGAEAVLADPAPTGDNASGVAAGMLAPAFEAVLDPVSAGHFELYREARDRWPDFGAGLDSPGAPQCCGALWVARDETDLKLMRTRLTALGAKAEAMTPGQAEGASPGLAAPAGAVFTPEDWRVDPRSLLAALRRAFEEDGGRVRQAKVTGFDGGHARLSDGRFAADAVILASGLAPVGFDDPPVETALLVPIKGQILQAIGRGPCTGPVVRAPGVYVVPGVEGPWIGATMQAGASDRRIDLQVSADLAARAAELIPGLGGVEMRALVGVRAATPDGLPLIGASSRPGLFLALGARRNGWLLAPLLAELMVASLAGRDMPARLDARRFDRALSPG